MRDYLSQNATQILDGLLFGLGVLAVYLGAVFTGALIRSLGGAGSQGLMLAGKYAQGWFYYLRGDDRDIVNITINMIADNHLKFDTLVADRNIREVWPNAYRAGLIRRAAKHTTVENPVVMFPKRTRGKPKSMLGHARNRAVDKFYGILTSADIVENGRSRRVRLTPEDDYKATYGPLISLISEKCSNDNAIDLSLGRPMTEHRFIVALTFEKLHDRRARHLRTMVIYEPSLLGLPAECPRVDFEEHRTRYRTLQAIARVYKAHPECFGIVKVWRPRERQMAAGGGGQGLTDRIAAE